LTLKRAMASDQKNSGRQWNDKVWDPEFANDRKPLEEPYVAERRRIGLKGSAVRLLFRDHKALCEGIKLDELVEDRPAAWLDLRAFSARTQNGVPREQRHRRNLNAKSLYRALREQVQCATIIHR